MHLLIQGSLFSPVTLIFTYPFTPFITSCIVCIVSPLEWTYPISNSNRSSTSGLIHVGDLNNSHFEQVRDILTTSPAYVTSATGTDF